MESFKGALCFFRSDVCDRNTEGHGPEGQPDGLLCHCASDGLLQRDPEHLTVGSRSPPGVRLRQIPTGLFQEPSLCRAFA